MEIVGRLVVGQTAESRRLLSQTGGGFRMDQTIMGLRPERGIGTGTVDRVGPGADGIYSPRLLNNRSRKPEAEGLLSGVRNNRGIVQDPAMR
jgi:hypothetical protein